MTSERMRTFLGLWMPLILGALLIAVAVNFLVRTSVVPVDWPQTLSWDIMRFACAGGLVFVGIVLFISTSGRSRRRRERTYRKAREARTEDVRPPKSES